jgi:hypothetical protein
MADLNADLILQGVDTTHPVMAETPEQSAQNAATLAQTRAGTLQTQAQTTGLNLQNQLAQQNLQNNQISAQAYLNIWNKTKQQSAQPQTPASATATPLDGSANTVASTTPGVIDPSTPPPPAGVNPTAWQYAQDNNLKIDTTHDWYTDQDGTPVSHSSGPAVSPMGRPNMTSSKMLDAIADEQQRLGMPVQAIVAQRMAGDDKAAALDKAFTESYKDTMSAQDSAAKAAEASASAQKTRTAALNDVADADLIANKNGIPLQQSVTQSVAQMPRAWLPQLAKVGIVPQQGQDPIQSVVAQINDPNNQQKLTGLLSSMQQQSPAFLERQKNAAEGVHIIAAHMDPDTGLQVPTQAVKVGPDGKVTGVVVNSPGGGGSAAPTTDASGNPLPPKKTPVQAYTDAVGLYQSPMTQVPVKLRPAVEAAVHQQYPDNDQTQYAAKNKALIDYTSGADHKTVVAIQTAYNHLDQLKTATEALNSGNTPLFNQVKLAYQKATGNELPTDAQAIKLVALDEVSKALTGAAGGEGDREAAQNIVNLAGAPNQVGGAIDKLRGLMQGKVGPLQDAATAAGLSEKQKQNIFGNLYQVPGANGRVGGAETPKPAATALPLAGKTVSPSQLQQYMTKNGYDQQTAMTKLKALGASF